MNPLALLPAIPPALLPTGHASKMTFRPTRLLALPLMFALATVAACSPGDDAAELPPLVDDRMPAPEADASDFAWTELAPGSTLLYSIEGLQAPEAVKYDPTRDMWIISNWAESGEANDGFLSLAFAEDGQIFDLFWARGGSTRPLLQPRGMAIQGDSLWVADANGVHLYNLKDAGQLDFIDLSSTEPGFLNDVAIGPDSAVYVTDSSLSRITRIRNGEFSVVDEGEHLGSPNGIAFDPQRNDLVIVPWVGGDTIRTWSMTRGVTMIARTPGGRFDGVEPFEGGLVIASQVDSSLHVVAGAEGRAFQRVPGRPADIAIDPIRRRVAVPYIALNRVDVYALPAGRPGDGGGR